MNNIRACAKGDYRKGNHLCIITERRQRKIFAAIPIKNSERIFDQLCFEINQLSQIIETIICFPYNGIVRKKKEVIIMQVEIKIDSSYIDPKVIILTASMTEDVSNIVKKLSEDASQIISGHKDEKIEILEQTDLIRIYANSGKVFAVTNKGEYILRLRLYEIENRLPSNQFIRISNSEIINLKKVNNFDLSFTGTICVKLSNGITTYVSRRYVPKLKKILGI